MLRDVDVPPGAIALCFLGQSGFLLKGHGTGVAAIDPYLSDRAGNDPAFGPPGRWARLYPPPFAPAELDADVVLVTHEHADHFDPLTLGPFKERHPSAPIVAPRAVSDDAIAAVPGETTDIEGFKVHAVPAAHAVSFTGPGCYGLDPERFCGYVVDAAGVRVYHAGDTILHPAIAEAVAALRPAIALVPINGRDAVREDMGIVGNLTIREAGQLCRDVGARFCVPSHHDLFAINGEEETTFVEVMRREFADQEFLILKPGRTLVISP